MRRVCLCTFLYNYCYPFSMKTVRGHHCVRHNFIIHWSLNFSRVLNSPRFPCQLGTILGKCYLKPLRTGLENQVSLHKSFLSRYRGVSEERGVTYIYSILQANDMSQLPLFINVLCVFHPIKSCILNQNLQ